MLFAGSVLTCVLSAGYAESQQRRRTCVCECAEIRGGRGEEQGLSRCMSMSMSMRGMEDEGMHGWAPETFALYE